MQGDWATKRTNSNNYAEQQASHSSLRQPSKRETLLLAALSTLVAAGSLLWSPNQPRIASAADSEYRNAAKSPGQPIQRVMVEPSVLSPLGGGDVKLVPEKDDTVAAGRIVPSSDMEKVDIRVDRSGRPRFAALPRFESALGSQAAAVTGGKNFVFFTISPQLQRVAESLVDAAGANHVAVVAMNVKTGGILAMASKSTQIANLALHSGFPAASLFKVVTATAAIEQADIRPETMINFRGGTYTLTQANYLPDPRRDRRVMSVAEAMAKSCNPVFGQLGLRFVNGPVLQQYARSFGFNTDLGFEAPLTGSRAMIPTANPFEFSRTAAGFGEVSISPVHAAAIMSGIANGGLLPRPMMVDRIVRPDGQILYRNRPESLQRIMQPTTARTLLSMMEYTTTIGTSRREFMAGDRPVLGNLDVAAKTGTLSGDNPVGLNSWFIGAAPTSNPELAVAVVSVDPRRLARASHIARQLIQEYFGITPVAQPVVMPKKYYRSAIKKRSYSVSAKKKAPAKYRSVGAAKLVKKKSKVSRKR